MFAVKSFTNLVLEKTYLSYFTNKILTDTERKSILKYRYRLVILVLLEFLVISEFSKTVFPE